MNEYEWKRFDEEEPRSDWPIYFGNARAGTVTESPRYYNGSHEPNTHWCYAIGPEPPQGELAEARQEIARLEERVQGLRIRAQADEYHAEVGKRVCELPLNVALRHWYNGSWLVEDAYSGRYGPAVEILNALKQFESAAKRDGECDG